MVTSSSVDSDQPKSVPSPRNSSSATVTPRGPTTVPAPVAKSIVMRHRTHGGVFVVTPYMTPVAGCTARPLTPNPIGPTDLARPVVVLMRYRLLGAPPPVAPYKL